MELTRDTTIIQYTSILVAYSPTTELQLDKAAVLAGRLDKAGKGCQRVS